MELKNLSYDRYTESVIGTLPVATPLFVTVQPTVSWLPLVAVLGAVTLPTVRSGVGPTVTAVVALAASASLLVLLS